MSMIASGAGGEHLEVYTLLRIRGQTAGVSQMALDDQSRFANPPSKESRGAGLFSELK